MKEKRVWKGKKKKKTGRTSASFTFWPRVRVGFSIARSCNGSIVVNTVAGWAEYRYAEEVQGEA